MKIIIAIISTAIFVFFPYQGYAERNDQGELIPSYEAAIDMVKKSINNNDFIKAELIIRQMLKKYPNNYELLSILARVLFWQKKYEESIDTFNRVLQLHYDKALNAELEKVKIAKILNDALILEKKGELKQAKEILTELFESKREQYESGYRLGMIYIKEREYEKALEIFKYLSSIFPDDKGFKSLYIESLILNRKFKKAGKELSKLSKEEKSDLYIERPDLFYRVKPNYLKLSGSWYDYSEGGRKSEREVSLEVSQRINNFVFVLNAINVSRYGLNDKQISLDVYNNFGEKSKRWGFLSLSISPDPKFLPKTSFGGEIYRGYRNYEFFIGYRHMSFKDASVDILIPGIIIYLPYNLSLNERLYLVPKNGAYSILSTLHYEPNHRIRAFYSISIGKSADRIGAFQDIQKIFTIANRLGIEWRLTPHFSIGSELAHEFRKDLYTRYGLTVFSKVWW